MAVVQWMASVFTFKTIPTTILIFVVYTTIFSAIFLTEELPKIPADQGGLNIVQAYADLQKITEHPHPYSSHANDAVRSYILSRIEEIARDNSHVHIGNDLISNGSWASATHGVYFEGTNILVKIDGSDPQFVKSGGVLFSAHYDSVSTAPGATDDGMGVVTLMQLIDYLTKNRPRRTAIFNINNGEEDWLNGAHAFLQHPWSNITESFLNLEGAASGGRPMLFRATSTAPLSAFLPKHVPHPHANVFSADAFARGLIRSGTDYSVYTAGERMQGADVAFYKGRSKYHTRFDSVPFTEGGKRSLWSMMETAKGAGLALLNNDQTHSKAVDKPVYFDLFNSTLVLLSLTALLAINIVFLVIGPVTLVLLIAGQYIVLFYTRHDTQNGSIPRDRGDIYSNMWEWLKGCEWLVGLWKWGKFWLALIVTAGFQVALVAGYVKFNPYIVYSSPYIVLITAMLLSYLTLSLVLNIPIMARSWILPEQQKHTTLLQIYLFTWFLLLLSTILIKKAGVGGTYFVTFWNGLAWLGSAISCLEEMFGARGTTVWEVQAGNTEERILVRGVRYDADQHHQNGRQEDEHRQHGIVETEATEITPLLLQRRSASPQPKAEERSAMGWWILQLLLVIPFPVILVSHLGLILVNAFPQTLADGSSAVTVYAGLSLISFLLVLPVAPFVFKVHRNLTYTLALVFVGAILYGFLAFPFSQDSPLKVFFQQKIHVDLDNGTTVDNRAFTSLTGVPEFLQSRIITQLPSARGKTLDCHPESGKDGLITCTWESALVPSPGGVPPTSTNGSATRWLSANVTRLTATSARIFIKGVNTRSCRLYFDQGTISRYLVAGGASGMQPNFEIPESGLKEVRLWSRSWDREFVVDVEWGKGGLVERSSDASHSTLTGRVACEWVEYESGSTGIETGAKIPAFEEVLSFLPKWAVASKTTDGLVEVWANFTLS